MTPLALPTPAILRPHLGAFHLAGIWQLDSPVPRFGGYSALVPVNRRRMMAISDQGGRMLFNLPGKGEPNAKFGGSNRLFTKGRARDIESATFDPAHKVLLMGLEGANTIVSTDRRWRSAREVAPALISGWGKNSGAEAMTWLQDGRVVLLREAFAGYFDSDEHEAVMFDGNPVEGAKGHTFRFIGPARFAPTDMAQMPDGRVLILMRRLVWPMPQRFAGRLAIADPREIRPGGIWRARAVARLSSSLPVDNFEGMAILPQGKGRIAVWIISDDNKGALQRTLLWKLTVDPKDLTR
ncbi:esterase-like activity of phytase family protein [Novosphingobium aquimarinum]|uniref:esterase-like activity of phytase family protein n=1 Tax=Novosphingobium aquimarinum TaxID=2682494 RepID=UPI001E5B3AFC|nr:esterase-like activity of phytase family protein [Novosphingobium aquimarinum]